MGYVSITNCRWIWMDKKYYFIEEFLKDYNDNCNDGFN